jgi:hypothetical protein
MNSIAEIQRIEADLYRFIQNASEPYKWIKAYLEPIGLFDEHVEVDDFEEIECSLKKRDEELETAEQSVNDCEAVIQLIATALHGIIGNAKPDFPMILMHIASVIEQGDHTIRCDADEVCEAIEEFVAGASGSAPDCLNSDTVTDAHRAPLQSPTTNPEPKPNDENQTEHHPVIRTPRCLPGFGKRAA